MGEHSGGSSDGGSTVGGDSAREAHRPQGDGGRAARQIERVLVDFTNTTNGMTAAKIVVAGGFGVGKTTFVGSVSEIGPLRTEAAMTAASIGVDEVDAVPGKETTTVAMDFGRLRLGEDLVLYVFGTPGQHRFWFMWDEIVRGAIAAIVLVDTRRLSDCFAAIDYFETRDVPFLVAVNRFDDAHPFRHEEIRDALGLSAEVAVVDTDARDPESTRRVLIAASEYALAVLTSR